MLAAKRRALNQVLYDDSLTFRQRFRQCERIVKRAVYDAKKVWIKKMAEAANVEWGVGVVLSSCRKFFYSVLFYYSFTVFVVDSL